MIAACGGGDKSAQAAAPDTTTTEQQAKIIALENSGAIPKLDRSDSLAGPDANANGVRDDVDAYIAAHYLKDDQRKAATQLAKGLQEEILIEKGNISKLKTVAAKASGALNCVYQKFDAAAGDTPPSKVSRDLEAISANTKPRLMQYLAFSRGLSGTSFTLVEGETCE